MAKRDDSSLGKNFRLAAKKLTKGLIQYRLKRAGLPTPDEETIDKGWEGIVVFSSYFVSDKSVLPLEEICAFKM